MSSTVANVNDFDEDDGGLSGFTILAIATTLLVVFALVVAYAYNQGVATANAQNEQLPVVGADPSPVVDDVPLDVSRNGPRQEVQDRVFGSSPTEIVTAENPSEDALAGYAGAPPSMLPRDETVAAEPATTQEDEVAAVLASTSEPQVRTISPPSRNPRTAQTQAASQQTSTPVQEPVRVSTPPATTPASTGGAVAAGTHVVQVGAFPSNDSALDYFDSLSTRMGAMLSGKLPDIQVAEVNGRTYHRLRIGPFTSKAEADRYCADLKTRGQDCLVRGV